MVESVFLNSYQIGDFRKNKCIFSNDEFRVKLVKSQVEEEWQGSGYYEYQKKVARRHYLVQDLDLYVFNFDFTDESREVLSEKRKEFEEVVRRFRTEQAGRLREHLTQKYKSIEGLPDSQRDIAIEASVGEYNADLCREVGYWNFNRVSKLTLDINRLFHLLKLEDLKGVTSSGEDPENQRYSIDTYGPQGLKSHKTCWPFEQFEGERVFNVKFKRLYETVMRNPVFGEKYIRKGDEIYQNVMKPPFFEHAITRDGLNDLESFVLGLDVQIKAWNYNPLDHM